MNPSEQYRRECEAYEEDKRQLYREAIRLISEWQEVQFRAWDEVFAAYAVPESRWSVARRKLAWHTVGRFRRWLHRDCR